MARGNEIIVSAEPNGRFLEGVIANGQTLYPGTIMQIDPSVAMVGGRHTWTAYSRDADGNRPKGPYAVLLPDSNTGQAATTAYAASTGATRCFLYCPLPGDELNLLHENVAGTGDDVALGDILIVDSGTGKMKVTASTPESECAVALESRTDPTSDALIHCMWSGH
jgi:hypothetical protein